ncbi:hypothetical protein TNCV_4794731 [Trichonephila clavipes]|nr:hypothetical protein TNCV_4794731 [Trichonephila clavipes]
MFGIDFITATPLSVPLVIIETPPLGTGPLQACQWLYLHLKESSKRLLELIIFANRPACLFLYDIRRTAGKISWTLKLSQSNNSAKTKAKQLLIASQLGKPYLHLLELIL